MSFALPALAFGTGAAHSSLPAGPAAVPVPGLTVSAGMPIVDDQPAVAEHVLAVEALPDQPFSETPDRVLTARCGSMPGGTTPQTAGTRGPPLHTV